MAGHHSHSLDFNRRVDRTSYKLLQSAAIADELGEAMHEAVYRRPVIYPLCMGYLALSCLPTSFGIWSAATLCIYGAIQFHPSLNPLRQRIRTAKTGDAPLRRFEAYLKAHSHDPDRMRLDKYSLCRDMNINAACQAWLATWHVWQSLSDTLSADGNNKQRTEKNCRP